jgi:hypothetical protein
MNTPIYVCEGTCGAKISQEQYNAGLTQCGADECTRKNQEFTKMYTCDECHEVMKENQPHAH